MQVLSLGTPPRLRDEQEKESPMSSTADKRDLLPKPPKIDYKSMTFELMKEVTHLKTREKSFETEIGLLEDRVQGYSKEISAFLKKSECGSFQEVL
jgi:predicted  nucleic acid-binding Zn-ribbon protein